MDFGYIFTSTQGRIPRSQWWAGVIILGVVGAIIAVIITYSMGTSTGAFIAIFILQIVFIYPSYAISAKRFQDRNKPGILALLIIAISLVQTLLSIAGVMGNPMAPTALDWIFNIALAIIGFWFLIELGILRGTIGPNTYGPDPLEGKVL